MKFHSQFNAVDKAMAFGFKLQAETAGLSLIGRSLLLYVVAVLSLW